MIMPRKSSIGSELFKKLNFQSKFRKFEISGNLKILRGMRSCSTSYSSGNLVDGSPLVAIAKLARLGPAENGKPMQTFLELSRSCSMT